MDGNVNNEHSLHCYKRKRQTVGKTGGWIVRLRQIERKTDKYTENQTDRWMYRQIVEQRQTDRQASIWTYRQTNRQRDRQVVCFHLH